MIIYPGLLLPAASSDPPESRPGRPVALVSVLLRMGFTCASAVTSKAVVSYTAFPPLPVFPAVYFCCTFLGVASTGRYPAFCPVKPGLSSPAAFRRLQPRSFVLLILLCNLSDSEDLSSPLSFHITAFFSSVTRITPETHCRPQIPGRSNSLADSHCSRRENIPETLKGVWPHNTPVLPPQC